MNKLVLFASLALYAGTSFAGPKADTMPVDKNIIQGKLPNGFTYYIRKNKTPEKRAYLYLVNKAGSILETEEQRGLAHFLEHMAFNGTRHFPKNTLVDYLQKSGVRFGADLNAYTAFDQTVYQLPIASDDKTILSNAFQVMRDWAGDISLDSLEVEKERGVIMSEKRQGETASGKIKETLMPMQLNFSRYADRLPIGTEKVLLGFKHKEIKAFYKNWYRPNLQALIVVGDIDVQETEATIKRLFGDLQNPPNALPRKEYTIPLLGKNQFRTLVDPEEGNTTLQFNVKLPGQPLQTEEQYKVLVLRSIVSKMAGARLAELTKTANSPFLRADYSIQKAIANLDMLSSSVAVKPGGLEKGVKAWWAELERIRKQGFTKAELSRAVTSYLMQYEASFKEKDKTPSDRYVQEYVNLFLTNEATPGIEYEYALTKKILAGLDTSAVNKLFKEVLTPLNRDFIIVSNEKNKAELPDEALLKKWLADNGSDKLPAYAEKVAANTQLINTPPAPGKLLSETVDNKNGITTLNLANGVTILLKPTTFSNDQIFISATSPGGLSLVSDADFYNGSIAANLVGASGLAGMNMQDLQKWMTGKRAMISPYIGEMYEGLSGSASQEDMHTALQMIYLYFTQPQKNAEVFERFKEQTKLAYANSAGLASTALQDTLSAIFANGSFRKTKMPVELLDSLNMDKALAIFQQRFANAGDFTFSFIGNFKVDSIKPLLLQYLASLPSTPNKEQFKDLGFRVPSGQISRTLVKGKDPKASVQLYYPGAFNYNADTASQMKALASALQTKLMENLREDKGGVYTVQANVGIQKYPVGNYNFSVRFICDTASVDMLVDAVNKEISLLKENGPDTATIEKYKAVEKRGLDKNLNEDGFWMMNLNSALQQNEPIDIPARYQRIESVTTESVKAAAIHYLNPANYIRVVLLPEAK